VILKHTSLAPITETLNAEPVYSIEHPSRSLILISEDSPGASCPVTLTPTALLTTALILWLDYHSTGEIPNLDSPLVVTVNPLRVPTHNGAQHEVYTKKKTSILLNTT